MDEESDTGVDIESAIDVDVGADIDVDVEVRILQSACQESIDELDTKLLDMKEEKLEQERTFDKKIQLLEEEKQSTNKDYCTTLNASTDKITAFEEGLKSQREEFVSNK